MNELTCKAKILYFDKMSGEGMVELIGEQTPCLIIHACNIKGKKTWFPKTACVYYEKDQIVDVRVEWDDYVTFVIGLTPGHFDKEAWDSLDQDKLAFKCNSDGEATSGLFADNGEVAS